MELGRAEVQRIFAAVSELPEAEREGGIDLLTSDATIREEVRTLLLTDSSTRRTGRRGLEAARQSRGTGELSPGDRLGPWRLVRRLGAGGMGAVFLAERDDGLYAQQVAVKLLHGLTHPAAAVRLAGERRILAGLQHPGIARLYDGGTTPAGRPYLVMEYVEGRQLDQHCLEHGLDLRARLDLFLEVCAAVQAAHSRLVVHCDIKPGNVLVRADGHPVLLDFGIAQLLGDADMAHGFCTASYAAPELLAGAQATIASDIYGLGLLLAELLSGRRVGRLPAGAPVPAPSALAAGSVPWPRKLRGDLDAIVARACAQEPEARYTTVEALTDDIRRSLQQRPVRARLGERFHPPVRFLRRRWRELAAVAASLVLVAGFVWRLDHARAIAEEETAVARQVSAVMVSMFEAADPRKRGSRAGEPVLVQELLEHAANEVDGELDLAPLVRARLKGLIGMAYRNMGDVPRSQPLLADAAEALAAAGPRHVDEAAGLLNMLSGSLANNRHGTQGEAMARRALAMLGPDWPDTFRVAQSHNSLGLSLLAQQRYAEAESEFRNALALHEDAGREQFINVSLDNLGMALRRRGDLVQAREVFDRSVPIAERLFGRLSFDYWASHSEASLVLFDEGRLEEARLAFEENLARAPVVFGENSVYHASEHLRLAAVLIRLGRLDEAAAILGRGVRLAAEVMGEQSYTYSLALATRASLATARGDSEAAIADLGGTLRIRERELGAAHPDTSDARLELALALRRAGRDDDGLLRQAMASWMPMVPRDSVNGVRIRQASAEALLLEGRTDQAAAMLRETGPAAASVGPWWLARQRELEARLQRVEVAGPAIPSGDGQPAPATAVVAGLP